MAQAGKPIYLIANWKSNKTWAETEVFLQTFRGFREEGRVVNIICPPIPYLKPAFDMIQALHLPIKLGVQDISPFPFGTYTGAVAAGMVSSWANYAILGHSERRKWFHETNQEIANKIDMALEQGLTPVVCVDTDYAAAQIAAIEATKIPKCIFAYEPVAHISDGVHPNPDDPAHAEAEAKKIVDILDNKATVIYGGSVTTETVYDFLSQEHLQGALVGGASLTVESWKAIISLAARA